MVTIIKPNKISFHIGSQDLNRAIIREHYPLKTLEEVVAEMPRAKVFSGCKSGILVDSAGR